MNGVVKTAGIGIQQLRRAFADVAQVLHDIIDEEAEYARLGGDIKKLRRHCQQEMPSFPKGFG